MLDKITVQRIQADIRTALSAIEAKHNVKITRVSGRYSDTILTSKIEISTTGKSEREERTNDILPMMLKRHNLSGENINGKQLVGYNTKGKKYPWIYVDWKNGGKRFKTSNESAARLFIKEDTSMFIDKE